MDLALSRITSDIEYNFLEFNKYYDSLTEFNRKIPTFTKKEYEKTKDEIHYKIQLLPSILNQINSKTEEIYNLKNNRISDETYQKLELIKEKLNPKVSEMPNLIQEIYEREKIASLKLRNIKLNESQLDDSLSILQRSDHFRVSKLLTKEIIENQAYLEKRKEELEMIKKVSHQLREITSMMGEEVKMQGEKLNLILEDVEAARDNAKSGEDLISEAERESRKHCRKVLLICIGIFLVVALIITLIVLIFIGKE